MRNVEKHHPSTDEIDQLRRRMHQLEAEKWEAIEQSKKEIEEVKRRCDEKLLTMQAKVGR